MLWPPGSVKTSDQPLTAVVPVLVMVMFAVRPVFQALIVSETRHAPVAGGVDGGVEGGLDGGVDGGVEGGVDGGVVRPKKAMAAAAMPVLGRLCPAPWMLYASTCTVPAASA